MRRYLIAGCVGFAAGLVAFAAGWLMRRESKVRYSPSGTEQMAARLQDVARNMRAENGFNNRDRCEELRARLADATNLQEEVPVRQALGWELLKVGRNEEAAALFRAAMDQRTGVPGEAARYARERLRGNIGLA
jgi:hypothetical protein